MAYSNVGDLLVGDIPLPTALDPQKVIDDAADEIDSKIGFRYSTPIDISDPGPLSRPARLLLKRINNILATGRLLLQVAAPDEKDRLHAYANSLVREAVSTVRAIAVGEIDLEGATLESVAAEPVPVPTITNVDSESQVEAFYDRIANPDYTGFGYLGRKSHNPDSFVGE